MKTTLKSKILTFFTLACLSTAYSQGIGGGALYTPDGNRIHAESVFSHGQPTLIIFWKTSKTECCNELIVINELYKNSLKEKGIRVAAICIDCLGTIQHVKPFVSGHDIEFEVYIDKNGDFKRSMNVAEVPYTLFVDENNRQVCKQIGFCEGDQDLLCRKIEEHLIAIEFQNINNDDF